MRRTDGQAARSTSQRAALCLEHGIGVPANLPKARREEARPGSWRCAQTLRPEFLKRIDGSAVQAWARRGRHRPHSCSAWRRLADRGCRSCGPERRALVGERGLTPSMGPAAEGDQEGAGSTRSNGSGWKEPADGPSRRQRGRRGVGRRAKGARSALHPWRAGGGDAREERVVEGRGPGSELDTPIPPRIFVARRRRSLPRNGEGKKLQPSATSARRGPPPASSARCGRRDAPASPRDRVPGPAGGLPKANWSARRGGR